MTKRTIVLPTADNDGLSLATQLVDIETDILEVAGGFSVADSSGSWLGPYGQIYRDRNRTYTVTADPETDARLLALLPGWATLLRQAALYTDVATVEVSFVAPRVEVA